MRKTSTRANCQACNITLAQDNHTTLCTACRHQAHEATLQPTTFPPDLWRTAYFADAFTAQHMGKVCRASREHPFHHTLHRRGISQTTIGNWMGLTQAQVSRIETGPPLRNLDLLAHWARVLAIPPDLLWFDLPDHLRRKNFPSPSTISPATDLDPAVAASQNAWRSVRQHLNTQRASLAHAAAALYPPHQRLGKTPFLVRPGWVPPQPVPLHKISLQWAARPNPPTITGTEPQARRLCPLRLPHVPYDRYTSAMRYLDPPRLFENRPSYRLLDLSWSEEAGQMRFGPAAYFDKIDISETIGHEVAEVLQQHPHQNATAKQALQQYLAFRALLGDPFNLRTRAVIPAMTTLLLRRNRKQATAEFFLHWRDPGHVATAGGLYDAIPAGEFQPAGLPAWSSVQDFDLWRNIVREFSEELLGTPEHDGSRSTPLDYDTWPLYRALENARQAGALRVYCLGVGLDALTLAAAILTVLVIDDNTFAEVLPTPVSANAEGILVTRLPHTPPARQGLSGIPFTKNNVHRLLTTEPVASPGAACLALAWQQKNILLHT